MSTIARYCAGVIKFDHELQSYNFDYSEDQLRADVNKLPASTSEDVDFLKFYEEKMVSVLPTCIDFAKVVSRENGVMQIHEYQLQLMKEAANAGDAFAKLELLDEFIKVDFRNFQESAKLLEQVVRRR